MAKTPRKSNSVAKKTVPALAPKKRSIDRGEVIDLDEFCERFGKRGRPMDPRTAIKILTSLGLPVDSRHGIIFINGKAFADATETQANEGASS